MRYCYTYWGCGMPITLFEKVNIHIDLRRTMQDPLPKEIEAMKNAPPKTLSAQLRALKSNQTKTTQKLKRSSRRRNG